MIRAHGPSSFLSPSFDPPPVSKLVCVFGSMKMNTYTHVILSPVPHPAVAAAF